MIITRSGEELSRSCRARRSASHEPIGRPAAITEAVHRFSREAAQHDDMALVIVRLL
jgi:hypothetical protein